MRKDGLGTRADIAAQHCNRLLQLVLVYGELVENTLHILRHFGRLAISELETYYSDGR